MKFDGCSALITGASAGIGREFARQLANRAHTLVLVARRAERLNELSDELRNHNAQLNIHARIVDLCDKSQIEELVRWLEQTKVDIDLLVNNAGLGDYGSIATSDPDRDDRIIQVNITALTLLTRRLLPQMIAKRHGAILNVSSSAGFLPIPGMAVYAATKAYVNSFSEALRAELRGGGVTVTAVCPGPVHTEFGDVAKRPSGEPERGPEFAYVSVEKTARAALAAIEADKPLIIPGFAMKIAMFLVRITPLPVMRLAWRFGDKAPLIAKQKRRSKIDRRFEISNLSDGH
jgi:short-subunit dehydrogenase